MRKPTFLRLRRRLMRTGPAILLVMLLELGFATDRLQPYPPNHAVHARAIPVVTPRLVVEAGGHTGIIRELIFTADGRELISVGDDKTIRIWNVSSDGSRAALARTIRGQIHEGRAGMIAAAALSPPEGDGRQRWLAVGGLLAGPAEARNAVRLHDYATGDVAALLYGHSYSVLALAFSPSGRWLASAGKDNTVRIWDLESLRGRHLTQAPLVLIGHTDHIHDLAWSANGDRLASASSDYTISLWNTERLAQRNVTLLASLAGHDRQVQTVAFHPDGRTLVSGGNDRTIRRWDAHVGKSQGILAQAEHKVSALSFSPDGRLLLAGNNSPPKPDQLTLFSYPSGKTHRVFHGHENLVIATAFHPSGRWVASGGGEFKEILLWHADTGNILSRLEGKGRTIYAVGLSPDGRYLSWGDTLDYKSLNNRGPLSYQFDLQQLVRLSAPPLPGAAGRALEQVGKWTLVTERGGPHNYHYRLHVKRRWKWPRTIERRDINGYRHSAYTFTPDGQHVLSGGLNGVLRLYTIDGQLRTRLVGHQGEINAVAISADGAWAVSGSNDQSLKLWSLTDLPASGTADLAPTLSLFPTTDGEWVAWTPEGFLAASDQGANLIGYMMNQGLDRVAKHIPVKQLYAHFYRPDVVAPIPKLPDTNLASSRPERVAVFDFNSAGSLKEYGVGIAEILRHELASLGESVVSIQRQDLQRILQAWSGKDATGPLDDKTAVQLGKQAGANRIVVGSVVRFGKTLTVNARAVDVTTGEIKVAQSLRVNSEDDLASTSAVVIARRLLRALPLNITRDKQRVGDFMHLFAMILTERTTPVAPTPSRRRGTSN